MVSDQGEVLAANLAFYDAFARGDLEAMEAVWAQEHPCSCTHPGWLTLTGRDLVLRSWRGILGGPVDVQCLGPEVRVIGDVAWVNCREAVQGSAVVATNIFVREQDGWRLVHHHGSPVAAELSAQALKADEYN